VVADAQQPDDVGVRDTHRQRDATWIARDQGRSHDAGVGHRLSAAHGSGQRATHGVGLEAVRSRADGEPSGAQVTCGQHGAGGEVVRGDRHRDGRTAGRPDGLDAREDGDAGTQRRQRSAPGQHRAAHGAPQPRATVGGRRHVAGGRHGPTLGRTTTGSPGLSTGAGQALEAAALVELPDDEEPDEDESDDVDDEPEPEAPESEEADDDPASDEPDDEVDPESFVLDEPAAAESLVRLSVR
jgi:hypothetical protein